MNNGFASFLLRKRINKFLFKELYMLFQVFLFILSNNKLYIKNYSIVDMLFKNIFIMVV